jgi:hypothetical protein
MIIESILNISVDTENGYVRITNDSIFTVEICGVPKNNKRKVLTNCIIHPKQFWLVDNVTEFNLKDYYIRFV